jgi:hypothetical protein
MSVPGTQRLRRVCVSQITRGPKCCLVLVFMQNDFPSKQERIPKEYRVLPHLIVPICCKDMPPWNSPSIF